LCLLPTLQFGWLDWDDKLHVTANRAVTAPSEAGWRSLLLTPELGYPIPVTVASYMLDHALYGVGPLGFHLSQLIYQLMVCALYFGLSRALGLSAAGAALALLVFALHPASAEPVSWLSGRKDVLAALWGLAALRLSLVDARWALPGSVICYALALLSKPSAAALAVFAVVLPHVIGAGSLAHDMTLRAWIRRSLPYAIVLAPIVLLGLRGQASVGALAAADDAVSGWQAAWYALGHHLSVLFLWEETTAKYLPAVWPPVFTPRVDLAPFLCLALLALALRFTRARSQLQRVVLFGAAWAALTYLPSSGLFFALTRFLADSYLYLPLMGVGWVAAAVFDRVRELASTQVARIVLATAWACALALVPCFVRSSARFADDERLWSHALARFPQHRRVCRQWANAVAQGRGPEAGLSATDACIARFGAELFVRNRALLLTRLGRQEEALAWLRAQDSGALVRRVDQGREQD
jgi:hypothetical protein